MCRAASACHNLGAAGGRAGGSWPSAGGATYPILDRIGTGARAGEQRPGTRRSQRAARAARSIGVHRASGERARGRRSAHGTGAPTTGRIARGTARADGCERQVLGNEDASPNRRAQAPQADSQLEDSDRRLRIEGRARIVGGSLCSCMKTNLSPRFGALSLLARYPATQPGARRWDRRRLSSAGWPPPPPGRLV